MMPAPTLQHNTWAMQDGTLHYMTKNENFRTLFITFMSVLAYCTILLDQRVKAVHRPALHNDIFALIVFDRPGAVDIHTLLLTQIRVLTVPAVDTCSLIV